MSMYVFICINFFSNLIFNRMCGIQNVIRIHTASNLKVTLLR